MSTDAALNKLYKQFEKIYNEDPNNHKKLMRLLDKIMERRMELGEITEEELESI